MGSPVTVNPNSSKFRDLSDTESPTYLLGPFGKRYRYAMSVLYDALADATGYAVMARYPSTAPSDAFGWLSEDRQMLQGFAESQASYIGRLKQWLDVWGWAGTPTGVLLAVLGYCLPVNPESLTVDNHGQWWTYAAGTYPLGAPPASMPTPPVQTLGSGNWRWDSVSWPAAYSALWARMWVVIFSTSSAPWAAPSATYGGGATYGDGTCYGWAGTNAQAAALTVLVRRWRAANIVIPYTIVSYDGTMFDSTKAFGSAKLPDGQWRWWSKVVNGQYVAARPAATTCSFLDGTSPAFG